MTEVTTPLGTVRRDDDGARMLEFRRRFRYPIGDVWSAVTESDRLAQSMPPDMDSADVGPGWHWYLDRLAASLAGAPMPEWEDYPALASDYR
jgi:hypothetical protein